MKRGHEQVGPAVAIDIAPGGSVTADAGQVREDARFIADIPELKGLALGTFRCALLASAPGREQNDTGSKQEGNWEGRFRGCGVEHLFGPDS